MYRGDKLGSHVGVVLSILIFIVFLVFLYTILEPALQTDTEKKFLLGSLKGAITEAVEGNNIVTILNITGIPDGKTCVRPQNIENELPDLLHLIIKDEDDIEHNYSESGGAINIYTGNMRNIILKISFSPNFIKSPDCNPLCNGCDPVPQTRYEVSSIIESTYIFETKMINLATQYNNDPEGLKDQLGIPDKYDFSFSMLNSTREVIVKAGEENPSAQNIYVEEFLIQYMDENANINPGYLIIKIW